MNKPLKIIHFSASDGYGAHRATYLLHKALLKYNIRSSMLVKTKTEKTSGDKTVIQVGKPTTDEKLRSLITKYRNIGPLYLQLRRNYRIKTGKPLISFNENISTLSLDKSQKYLKNMDVICIHWIDNFLSTKIIRQLHQISKAPIVWTLMDIEPLTGGCHYPENCNGFTKMCGNCPQLQSSSENDLSREMWLQNKSDLQDLPITFVAPSSWIYKKIKLSSLYKKNRVEKILLSIDTDLFHKSSKVKARRVLGLPNEKKIIFFAARDMQEKRKGMQYLMKALKNLKNKLQRKNNKLSKSIMLLTAGNRLPDISNLFSHKHLGFIDDLKTLVYAYQAADVFACPSIEDGGPMMVNESIMCGTPVIAFKTGVAVDLIDSPKKGYLAKLKSSKDLAEGLYNFIYDNSKSEKSFLEKRCTPEFQAKQYIQLFQSLL